MWLMIWICFRACPGKHMALSTFQINVVSLLHSFDITPPVDVAGNLVMPEIEYVTRLTRYIVNSILLQLLLLCVWGFMDFFSLIHHIFYLFNLFLVPHWSGCTQLPVFGVSDIIYTIQCSSSIRMHHQTSLGETCCTYTGDVVGLVGISITV